MTSQSNSQQTPDPGIALRNAVDQLIAAGARRKALGDEKAAARAGVEAAEARLSEAKSDEAAAETAAKAHVDKVEAAKTAAIDAIRAY